MERRSGFRAQPSGIQSLVEALVPACRSDESLRRDLVDHCQELLNSKKSSRREPDISHLSSIIKRQLTQASSSSSSVPAQRFTNLLQRLLDQVGTFELLALACAKLTLTKETVTQKHDVLLFLHSLHQSPSSSPVESRPRSHSLLPSLTVPSVTVNGHKSPANGLSPSPLPPLEKPSLPKSSKTKADILKEYRAKAVRDTLYLLQGISGNYVFFEDADGEEERKVMFRESSKWHISPSTQALVLRLSELGHLYSRVSSFVRDSEGQPSIGLIKQSLCHHLQQQLTEYYRMVAVLESQMKTKDDPATEDAPQTSTGLTLRRLEVWTEDWTLRMRMMSVSVEACRSNSGGALVSSIHEYTDNGDPFIRQFTDQLLEEASTHQLSGSLPRSNLPQVSKPFFATLHRWIYSGDLQDPFLEFFVAVDPQLANQNYSKRNSFDPEDMRERETGAKIWKSKYKFRKEMLPRFVGEEFGRKIFSTGKSLNFIRYSCQDSEWVATRSKLSTTGKVLKYSDIAGLERSIDSAYQVASKRLFDMFFDKFKLMDHLLALKSYLLLGHGDFAEHLMETLSPHLAKPANNLQRHKLTSSLETAIRATNAQLDPVDVLRRLDARMLEFTHGEIGWDVFTLEYKVDSPVDTVLDPEAMRAYLRIFSHLWRMKRVDIALRNSWMKITSESKAFARVPGLKADWHQVRIAMSEMIFFIRQLQTYTHLVVIEGCWKELQEFLGKKEGDLDSLIQAHRAYLERMETRAMLLRSKHGKREQYLSDVKECFDRALNFVEGVDSFHNHSLNVAARLDAERDEYRGVYTREGRTTPVSRHDEGLQRTLRRLREFSTEFSERACRVAIGTQTHEDSKCKVLGQMLAFSDYYANKRQRLREEETAQAQGLSIAPSSVGTRA
ncbi:Microtubule-nucleating Tub4p (gamma-tubulin) complex component [Tulasnella sp. 425]|nr:Microtubule-nucleating Tub4p (gamma-tubulin) complex component [Tulasnella sp. 425]